MRAVCVGPGISGAAGLFRNRLLGSGRMHAGNDRARIARLDGRRNIHRCRLCFSPATAICPMGVDAMKKGAVDFLQKPVDDEALLQAFVARWSAMPRRKLTNRNSSGFRPAATAHATRARGAGIRHRRLPEQTDCRGAADRGEDRQDPPWILMHKMEVSSVADLVRQCETAGIAPRAISDQ